MAVEIGFKYQLRRPSFKIEPFAGDLPADPAYQRVMDYLVEPNSKLLLIDRENFTTYLWDRIHALRPQTAYHSMRVANYLEILAISHEARIWAGDVEDNPMGLPLSTAGIKETVRDIGLLHDIGKITPEFWNIYGPKRENVKMTGRLHATLSSMYLKALGYRRSVLDAVAYHHENWDGSGLQLGLQKSDIPRVARLLRYADFFDACMCRMPLENTLETMRTKIGTTFDPDMQPAFEYFAGMMREQAETNPHFFQVYEPFQAGKKPPGE